MQHAYKHAADFGINGNYNPANGFRLMTTLSEFMNGKGQMVVQGVLRNTPAWIYYNPLTRQFVATELDNSQLLSAWRMGPEQYQKFIQTGVVW